MAIIIQSVNLAWKVHYHGDLTLPCCAFDATITYVDPTLLNVDGTHTFTLTHSESGMRLGRRIATNPAAEAGLRARVVAALQTIDPAITLANFNAKVTRTVDPAFPQGT